MYFFVCVPVKIEVFYLSISLWKKKFLSLYMFLGEVGESLPVIFSKDSICSPVIE